MDFKHTLYANIKSWVLKLNPIIFTFEKGIVHIIDPKTYNLNPYKGGGGGIG